jgi:hypothetical protein
MDRVPHNNKWGLAQRPKSMRASGIIRFEKLTALAVQILREIERSHPHGVGFTFGPVACPTFCTREIIGLGRKVN